MLRLLTKANKKIMIQKIKMLVRAWHYKMQENPNEIAFIIDNAKAGDTLIDIGANKGGFLFWMIKKAGKNGKAIGFEPQTFLYRFLKDYFSGYPQVTIEQYALSDKEETATMIIPYNGKDSSPGASIHFTLDDSPMARAETVTTITLDNYCAKHSLQPALIKIDVEGHELKVIKGGLKTLAMYKPKIILECEALQVGRDTVQETFDHILGLGYKGHFFFKGTRYDISNFEPEKHQPEKFEGKKSIEYCSNFFFM
jgi:FkbM family methyltransferase